MKNCCVIGLGYIGLPVAALLAESGYKVLGVDVKKEIVEIINQGKTHFFEPELDNLVSTNIAKGSLYASTIPSSADVFIIAVPTPFRETKEKMPYPDISYVLAAANSICPFLKKGNLIILESTSPVGTTEQISNLIKENTNLELEIAYCPERVLPDKILKELINNDRVIGGINEKSKKAGKIFYSSFCRGSILTTNSKTAELVKLSENAYRDVNIAFANELSMICDSLDIDTRELIYLSNRHPRVNILNPGCGVGGHCIAVDPWFIVSQHPNTSKLISTARYVNDGKINWVINKIISETKKIEEKIGREPIIGLMGLTYKPDIDDLRESPAIKIAKSLIQKNLKVIACEPNIKEHQYINIYPEEYILEKADHLFFLTAHSRFRDIDLKNYNFTDFCGL